MGRTQVRRSQVLRQLGAVGVALTLLWPTAGRSEETFESLSANATPADLGETLEGLLMRCDDEPDDRARRACTEIVRVRRKQARTQTVMVASDPPRVKEGKKRGTHSIAVGGCLVCARPLVVAGLPRWVTASEPSHWRKPTAAHALPSDLTPDVMQVVIDDPPAEVERPAFEAVLKRLRSDVILKLHAPRQWKRGDHSGVTVTVVGVRVVDPCTGKIYLARPPSDALPPSDDPACRASTPKPAATPTAPPLRLTPLDLYRALEPVRRHARICYTRYRIRGRVDLALDVRPDGTVKQVRSSGPLIDTPTAHCVRSAAIRLLFPPSRDHSSLHIEIPIQVP
jgi:hypothetical protein